MPSFHFRGMTVKPNNQARPAMRFIAAARAGIGRISVLALATLALASCSSHAGIGRTALPAAFAPPASRPDFSSLAKRSAIERRILESECADPETEMSRIANAMTGLSTRPETVGQAFLDQGISPDGTRWFLHRNRDDPDVTYCGVALLGAGEGTRVSVAGVRSLDLAEAGIAVVYGDFFCECRRLSKSASR